MTVYPRYNYVQGHENFIGYEVNQNYTVHINDLSSYENFISELLKSGIKSIHNVNFTVEHTKEYADKARQNALKIATEKAELLCASTADKHKPKLGKLISISEDDFVSYGQIRAMNMKEEYSADTASDNFG
ncbi:MAG: SIMPL domain-containing protein, partial [Treponemataceae bacterium]